MRGMNPTTVALDSFGNRRVNDEEGGGGDVETRLGAVKCLIHTFNREQ